jgi:hypothetical protein
VRGFCNNPVICEMCGNKKGFPKRRLCRSCQVQLKNPNRVTKWTDGQLEMLREAYTGNRAKMLATRRRLMEITGYTRGSVDAQCRRMGLRMYTYHPYTPQEEQYLRESAEIIPLVTIARVLGRSSQCLRAKLSKMGLSSKCEREGLNQKEFAELMGVRPPTVRHWVQRGHLRMFDERITGTAVREFLQTKHNLYSVNRVDDEWFKATIFGRVPSKTESKL